MHLFCVVILGLIVSTPSAAAPLGVFVSGLPSVLGRATRNKLLLISFDGFRWDYDRDVDTPNLDQMAQDGIKAEYVTPPFLTITSPTHFTLLTGTKSWLTPFSWDRCNLQRRNCQGERGGTSFL
uniref:Ectonucleotide pyrophosphatase/phosphodiesterase 7 n=1 Tax=Hippocampus comes TaxID=109280 RepID=A0A3Q2YHQ1_HIPCM